MIFTNFLTNVDLTLIPIYIFYIFAFGIIFGAIILGFFRFMVFGFAERKD
jgi:hypothetical protein